MVIVMAPQPSDDYLKWLKWAYEQIYGPGSWERDKSVGIGGRGEAHGFSLSDIVRLSLALLPETPEEMDQSRSIKVRPLRREREFRLKGEREALKTLQEW